MPHKNERVELEMKIMKYRHMADVDVSDELTKQRIDLRTGTEAPRDRRVDAPLREEAAGVYTVGFLRLPRGRALSGMSHEMHRT